MANRWRNVLASAAGLTPSRGYLWPSDAAGRIGVSALEAENERLRAVVDAARVLREVAAADHEWKGYTVSDCHADLFAALNQLDGSGKATT